MARQITKVTKTLTMILSGNMLVLLGSSGNWGDNCSSQSKRNSQSCKMGTVAIETVGGVFANQTSGSAQHQATATLE